MEWSNFATLTSAHGFHWLVDLGPSKVKKTIWILIILSSIAAFGYMTHENSKVEAFTGERVDGEFYHDHFFRNNIRNTKDFQPNSLHILQEIN